MRVFDRYEGREVDLPIQIAPGRYRLLKSTVFNGDIPLLAGSPLLQDGRAVCQVGNHSGSFDAVEPNESLAVTRDLLVQALAKIAQKVRDGEKDVSPLIPASVGELAELSDLEKVLRERINHLREINQRPRMSMHYQPEVSPLSRARKVSPSAITYLARHSEDWYRRTLSGIQPKRILALFSEDEWAIYENRVYARLLEKLDSYLRLREKEVAGLERQYQDALSLGAAEHLDYRMRTSLCKLWGEAFSDDETERLLEASRYSLKVIGELRKQISVLRNGDLYGQVPRNANVPEQLRETNILQHDQHYRHLRTLWRLYQKRSAEKPATPLDVMNRNKQLFDDYVIYIGMLCRRVMMEFKSIRLSGDTFDFAGKSGRFYRSHDEWCLEYDQFKLVVVPTLMPDLTAQNKKNNAELRVLVALMKPDDLLLPDVTPSVKTLSLSPLDFFGLEKIRLLIESFVWRPVFDLYAKPIRKLPRQAGDWLKSKGFAQSVGHHDFIMPRPLKLDEYQQLQEWLPTAEINDTTRSEIRNSVEGLRQLSQCRDCGETAMFSSESSDSSFSASCPQCHTKWGIWTQEGLRVAEFGVDGVKSPSFHTHGTRYMRFQLS